MRRTPWAHRRGLCPSCGHHGGHTLEAMPPYRVISPLLTAELWCHEFCQCRSTCMRGAGKMSSDGLGGDPPEAARLQAGAAQKFHSCQQCLHWLYSHQYPHWHNRQATVSHRGQIVPSLACLCSRPFMREQASTCMHQEPCSQVLQHTLAITIKVCPCFSLSCA